MSVEMYTYKIFVIKLCTYVLNKIDSSTAQGCRSTAQERAAWSCPQRDPPSTWEIGLFPREKRNLGQAVGGVLSRVRAREGPAGPRVVAQRSTRVQEDTPSPWRLWPEVVT